jgi:hypothetical protein
MAGSEKMSAEMAATDPKNLRLEVTSPSSETENLADCETSV